MLLTNLRAVTVARNSKMVHEYPRLVKLDIYTRLTNRLGRMDMLFRYEGTISVFLVCTNKDGL